MLLLALRTTRVPVASPDPVRAKQSDGDTMNKWKALDQQANLLQHDLRTRADALQDAVERTQILTKQDRRVRDAIQSYVKTADKAVESMAVSGAALEKALASATCPEREVRYAPERKTRYLAWTDAERSAAVVTYARAVNNLSDLLMELVPPHGDAQGWLGGDASEQMEQEPPEFLLLRRLRASVSRLLDQHAYSAEGSRLLLQGGHAANHLAAMDVFAESAHFEIRAGGEDGSAYDPPKRIGTFNSPEHAFRVFDQLKHWEDTRHTGADCPYAPSSDEKDVQERQKHLTTCGFVELVRVGMHEEHRLTAYDVSSSDPEGDAEHAREMVREIGMLHGADAYNDAKGFGKHEEDEEYEEDEEDDSAQT